MLILRGRTCPGLNDCGDITCPGPNEEGMAWPGLNGPGGGITCPGRNEGPGPMGPRSCEGGLLR